MFATRSPWPSSSVGEESQSTERVAPLRVQIVMAAASSSTLMTPFVWQDSRPSNLSASRPGPRAVDGLELVQHLLRRLGGAALPGVARIALFAFRTLWARGYDQRPLAHVLALYGVIEEVDPF